jgi:hypothetical protein
LNSQTGLGQIDRSARTERRLTAVRWLLPVGWVLAAIGYYGPWISHGTAALTLSGADMAEFVKFLPGALDGSLGVVRQLFYLPPLAVVVSVALLVGSRWLRYPWPFRVLALILAIPVSLQMLPPAWSPSSLFAAEFRLQSIALGICWLLLAGFWLLGRLPLWVTGSLTAMLSLAAVALCTWQLLVVKPAIDTVYRTPPAVGWGFPVCMFGLVVMAAAAVADVLHTRQRSGGLWSSR